MHCSLENIAKLDNKDDNDAIVMLRCWYCCWIITYRKWIWIIGSIRSTRCIRWCPDGCGIQNYIVIEYDSIEYGIRYDRIRSLPVKCNDDNDNNQPTNRQEQQQEPNWQEQQRRPTRSCKWQQANDNKAATSVSFLIESDLIRSDQMLLFYATMITTIHNR